MSITYIPVYPVAHSTTYVKATTYLNTSYYPHFSTDPSLSKIGETVGYTWVSTTGTYTNQRFHVDLGKPYVIRRIFYVNYHKSGTETNYGAKNLVFQGSNSADSFAELTYATDTGWTTLSLAQNSLDQHTAVNEIDPKYIIVNNGTAYRYYAFKFANNYGSTSYLGVRHLELQRVPGGLFTFHG